VVKIRVSSSAGVCLDGRVTFASKITITRILMVPVFAVFALAYGASVRNGLPDESLRWWALGLFVTAAATDGVDGWVARRFNQMSKFGAFIDPIADKSLLLTGVITLSLVDWGEDGWRLPMWFAVIVVLRDCIILGGIRILWRQRRKVAIAPHWTGKVCTVTQMFALGWVMLKIVPLSPVWPCLVAGFFTIWSAVAYIRHGIVILRTGERVD
jgi:CDP-diacylglycerol--glycerol-3-phosphate 3-phosphatidyltransferase/cardiolipin synthase